MLIPSPTTNCKSSAIPEVLAEQRSLINPNIFKDLVIFFNAATAAFECGVKGHCFLQIRAGKDSAAASAHLWLEKNAFFKVPRALQDETVDANMRPFEDVSCP